MKWQLLVFTDLDGTLLDSKTYSYHQVLPALKALEEKNIPLIFCSSKTRAEIELLRQQLNNTHPFISENGGALFIPKGYFPYSFDFSKENSHYYIIEYGTSYSELRYVLRQMQTVLPGEIKGFGDLTVQEVAERCGLSLAQALCAKQREYDEPFLLEEESALKRVVKIASCFHLQINRGGRFYHLLGNCDKGRAVSHLTSMYRKDSPSIKAIALGDSFNDLSMLKVVDYPVLVKKSDGSYDPSIILDNVTYAPDIGPSGWCKAILEFLAKHTIYTI